FTAGSNTEAYAMLGNGGFAANGNHSGDITVRAWGDITFTAGSLDDAFAQLGNGGDASVGNHSGNITVSAGTTGVFSDLGDFDMDMVADMVDFGMMAPADPLGQIAFNAGSANDSYAQLGHGGLNARGDHGLAGETISVTALRDIVFTGGTSTENYVQIGNGGYDADDQEAGPYTAPPTTRAGNQGNIAVASTDGDITFKGGDGNNSYAQIGHGG
ncbi:MAG: hypothetical protein KDM91_22925, partial [Verrucomicrobiae bacterium]|nr:hypothetical protein [Verrucomicrobiae bacterium]